MHGYDCQPVVVDMPAPPGAYTGADIGMSQHGHNREIRARAAPAHIDGGHI